MSKKPTVSTDIQDEETHEQLMAAFREYFKANQKWINEGTKRSAIRLRQALAEIRIIARARRERVQEWRQWKDADWEVQKANRKAKRDQKQQAQKDNDAN